jgi:catechol 2,3-dioxygenase-like lactoylglutathione lyase family enzyme
MRIISVFVAGVLVGVLVHTAVAQNLAQKDGVVAMNHVAISVPNVEEAVAYYTQKLGFREAFRATNPQGGIALVYLQISQNTFLEIQPANAQRPAGINHFGLHVQDIKTAVAAFRQRGATVTDPNVSANTKALLANVSDLNGVRVELAELTPDSLHRKAMESWK